MNPGAAIAASPDLLSGSFPGAEKEVESVQPTDADQIELRIAELTREQDSLAAELQKVAGEDSTLASRHMARLLEKLEQIDRLLQAQASLAATLAEPVSAAPMVDEPSVLLLHSLYEQKAAVDAVLREKRSTLKAAKEQLDALTDRRKEAKSTLAGASADTRPRYARALRSAEMALRIQTEQINLDTLELRAAKAKAALGNSLENRIDAVREALSNREGDATSAIAALLERESALERNKSRAERQLATAELRLAAAKKSYADQPDAPGDALLVVEALTAFRDTIGKEISLATAELDRLASLREIWSNWEALLRSEYNRDELATWKELADHQLLDMKLAHTEQQSQLADIQVRLESVEAKKAQVAATSPVRGVLGEIEDALNTMQKELLSAERQLAADKRLVERFSEDVTAITGNLSIGEYLSLGLEKASELWSFEITTIDEAPFTVGSLTMGLLLFGVGLWASRLGAAMVARLAGRRLKLDMGAVHAIQTFSFYAFLIGFTLLALKTVHFPLTAFTFLGGALAIGVGFGSQNVMNNFISGLILMLERPVRAQDVVEVDGSHGVIQKIGPRSTHIRSTDGRHIVVPNSFFLESNVVNWTLSDDLMRTKVSVGVCYGSPTRLVEKLLQEVVKAEPLVLNDPPPNVIFDAFGDNALNFDVYFWVEARAPMRIRDAQSRVRFAIDEKFRENDLVIAFPQRDVHLDTAAPIDIRLIGGAGSEGPKGPGDNEGSPA
jgi:small-conductance mechanosensitive channel